MFPDVDLPLAPSYFVYILQLVRFTRVCTKVSEFNDRNLYLTAKHLQQWYRYNTLLKTFSKFYNH